MLNVKVTNTEGSLEFDVSCLKCGSSIKLNVKNIRSFSGFCSKCPVDNSINKEDIKKTLNDKIQALGFKIFIR